MAHNTEKRMIVGRILKMTWEKGKDLKFVNKLYNQEMNTLVELERTMIVIIGLGR